MAVTVACICVWDLRPDIVIQQEPNADEEARALPLLESLTALEAAWQQANQETVISSSESLSKHVARALEPGEYILLFSFSATSAKHSPKLISKYHASNGMHSDFKGEIKPWSFFATLCWDSYCNMHFAACFCE